MNTVCEKVLHIKYSLNPGGGCMIIYRLAQQLQDRYRFDWMTYSIKENDWAYKFEELGGTTKFFTDAGPLYHFGNIILYLRYIHYIKKNRYRIVHVNTDNPKNVRFLICAFLGGAQKRIMHSHSNGSLFVKNNLRTKFNKWLIGIFATDYVACSQEAADWMFNNKCARKTIILKNGLDIDSFRYDSQKRNTIRAKYGNVDGQFLIGHIGRFVPPKNHIFLLEVFKKVIQSDPTARLMLLGSGVLESKIISKIVELGIEKEVIVVGQVDNVQDYLNAMDVLALPSLYEGLGMVNIEAQTNGLVCVVSDRVSKLAKVTDLLSFFPLEDGIELWASYLLATKDRIVKREAYADIIRNDGWDIKEISEQLAKIYEL